MSMKKTHTQHAYIARSINHISIKSGNKRQYSDNTTHVSILIWYKDIHVQYILQFKGMRTSSTYCWIQTRNRFHFFIALITSKISSNLYKWRQKIEAWWSLMEYICQYPRRCLGKNENIMKCFLNISLNPSLD